MTTSVCSSGVCYCSHTWWCQFPSQKKIVQALQLLLSILDSRLSDMGLRGQQIRPCPSRTPSPGPLGTLLAPAAPWDPTFRRSQFLRISEPESWGAGGTGGGQGDWEVEMTEKEAPRWSDHTLRWRVYKPLGSWESLVFMEELLGFFSLFCLFISPLNLSLKNNLGNPWVEYVTCPFL